MAVFSAIATAITAISSWTIGAFAIGNFILQTAVSFGISALSRALAGGGPSQSPFSIKGSVRTGGTVPRSFLMGPSLTAGSLVWHSEWGRAGETPNAYYTQVRALSDMPITGLRRWFIDGSAVTLEDTGDEKGLAAVEYRNQHGVDFAWIRFHDGTQTAPDTFLCGTVNQKAPRAYSMDRIGAGVAYAIVTFRVNEKYFSGFPRSKFVVDGMPLYDVTKDSTEGGTGAHRWNDPTTWGGDGDALPGVQAYNIARGINYRHQFASAELTASATVSLTGDLAALSFRTVGGGAGPDVAGGDTVIRLRDGATVVQEWTATGGAPGADFTEDAYNIVTGELSPLSPHGDGGDGYLATYNNLPGGDREFESAGSYGGGAGDLVEVDRLDISGLTDPILEVVIGAPGEDNAGGGYIRYAVHYTTAGMPSDWFYGLQGLTAARLPAAHWIGQIEKCRELVDGEDGLEPIYRSAGEITVNSEIGSAFEAILTACAGRMSEVGGTFKLYVGAPDAPIAHFEDADIVSLEPQSFTPFFGLANTVNGVIGSYPSPDEGYVMRSTAPLLNPDYEVEDGGRRLVTNVEFAFVPFPVQVQRLLRGELNAARRARRHTHTLPARFRLIEPGDTVTWTSARNGYDAKLFRVDGIIDLPNCDRVVDLTEVDPTDHGDFDFNTDYTPVSPGPLLPVIPAAQSVVGFNPVAVDLLDDTGAARRPAIMMQWQALIDDVAGIMFEVRLNATGELIARVETQDFDQGALPVGEGILSATAYKVKAKYIPASPRDVVWSDWEIVTTNDVRLGRDDLGDDVVADLDTAGTAASDATQALVDAAAAADDAAAVQAEYDALTAGFVGDLATRFGGVDSNIQSAIDAADQAQGELDALTLGFTGDLQTRFDAVDGDIEAALAAQAPLGAAVLREPATSWTNASPGTHSSVLKPAPVQGAFLTSDTDFVEAYDFGDTNNQTIGQAYPVEFDSGKVFKVTYRYKAIDDGTSGGAYARFGVSIFEGTTVIQVNVQSAGYLSAVADGVQEREVYFSADSARLTGIANAIPGAITQVIGAPGAANKAYFHLRQNHASDGRIVVGSIEVRDITDVAIAYDVLRTELRSEIDGVNATLTQDYYTAAQVDSEVSNAVSAAQTTLQGNIDGLSATLTQDYYTAAQVDSEVSNAVSAAQTTLQGNIDGLSATLTQDYYTAAQVDSEVSSAVSAAQTTLQGNIDGLSATLTQDYYTGAQVSQEIGGAVAGSVSVLRAPANSWTNSSTSVGGLPKPAVASGTFITDDPDFVDCYEFPLADNRTIGQAFPTSLSPGKVYKVTYRYKAVNDGTGGGVRVFAGINLYSGASAVNVNDQQGLHDGPYLFVADGVQEQSVFFSADASRLADIAQAGEITKLFSGGGADLAYFHLRQNAGNSTDGQVRVASILIEDVTEVAVAYGVLRTELQSEIDGVNATLAQDFYTASEVDGEISTAVSAAELSLRSQIDRLAESPGNLLNNKSSFEDDDIGGWAGFGGYLPTVGTITGHPPWTRAMYVTDIVQENPLRTGDTRGRHIRIRGAARTKSGDTNLRIGIRRSDAGVYVNTIATEAVPASSEWADFDVTISVPPGTTPATHWRPRLDHDVGTNMVVQIAWIEYTDVTDAFDVNATLTNDYYTAAQVDGEVSGAVSAAQTTLQAQIDDNGASLTTQANAIADLEGNAAAGYLVKAQAGGEVSLLELVAADGSGAAGSVARVKADSILLEGSVFSRHLAVGDWTNYLSGGDMEDVEKTPWDIVSDPNSNQAGAYAHSGSWSVRLRPGCATKNLRFDGIEVKEGDEFYLEFWAYRTASGYDANGNNKIRICEYGSGDYIAAVPYVDAGDPLGQWVKKSGTFRIGANREPRINVQMSTDGGWTTGNIWLDDFVLRRRFGGELIVDGSITAGMGIFAGPLKSDNYSAGNAGWRINQNGSAEFHNLVVRSWLQDGAVSDSASISLPGPHGVQSVFGAWEILDQRWLTGVSANEILQIAVSCDIKKAGGSGQMRVSYEVKKDGSWRGEFIKVAPTNTTNNDNVQATSTSYVTTGEWDWSISAAYDMIRLRIEIYAGGSGDVAKDVNIHWQKVKK